MIRSEWRNVSLSLAATTPIGALAGHVRRGPSHRPSIFRKPHSWKIKPTRSAIVNALPAAG
jgi:hypothetical protein